MKYYAELHFWFNKPETIEIQKEHINDIVSAVEGQYTFIDNKTGLEIHGEQIAYVNIIEEKDSE